MANRPFPYTECCPHCDDYGITVDWYWSTCNWIEWHFGYDTVLFDGAGHFVYFFGGDLLSGVLNGILANFYLPSAPTSSSVHTDTRIQTVALPGVSAALTFHAHPAPSLGDPYPDEEDFTAYNVSFDNWLLVIEVFDTCLPLRNGQTRRYIGWTLYAEVTGDLAFIALTSGPGTGLCKIASGGFSSGSGEFADCSTNVVARASHNPHPLQTASGTTIAGISPSGVHTFHLPFAGNIYTGGAYTTLSHSSSIECYPGSS